ncbi:PiggyBac transposable element-derived protein 3 [Plakobranchus ocellatus]|uniref:PiggyBac transposable element-derived protein 3 n=1 Tax=Plakobranchus ocellatus TaxID=259542 RepID=A0AAV3ZG89_9GAST|nr:PiggyBac transposable element-derived protein 3 [Plakobranchus ocellatus]
MDHMVILFNMLDLASIVAAILFWLKFPNHKLAKSDNCRLFQIDIARALTCQQKLRIIASQNLPRQLKQTMEQQLGCFEIGARGQRRPGENAIEADPKKRKRCAQCPAKKDMKTSVFCDKCGISVCRCTE